MAPLQQGSELELKQAFTDVFGDPDYLQKLSEASGSPPPPPPPEALTDEDLERLHEWRPIDEFLHNLGIISGPSEKNTGPPVWENRDPSWRDRLRQFTDPKGPRKLYGSESPEYSIVGSGLPSHEGEIGLLEISPGHVLPGKGSAWANAYDEMKMGHYGHAALEGLSLLWLPVFRGAAGAAKKAVTGIINDLPLGSLIRGPEIRSKAYQSRPAARQSRPAGGDLPLGNL